MTRVDVRTTDEFESWVQPHLAGMRRFASTLVPSREDADELVQEALVNAWRKWATYDPARGSAQAWLFGIVFDQRRQWFRRRSRQPLALRASAEETEPGPTGLDLDLRRAVDKLPRRQREVVILHYYVGLPIAEIATVEVLMLSKTVHDNQECPSPLGIGRALIRLTEPLGNRQLLHGPVDAAWANTARGL